MEKAAQFFQRLIKGDLEPIEVKRYLAFESVFFWSVIFISWIAYPKEHKYSILTHTFSFLGSFEPKHNPDTWWIFSIAMFFWGMASVPMVLYIYRRFATISTRGARIGAGFFLLGCTGIALIAIFPDAHGKVIGNWEYTHIHMKAALCVAVGYVFGIPWYAGLLLKDRFWGVGREGKSRFEHGKFLWPYLIWTSMVVTAAYFLIRWNAVYAAKKAAAVAAGQSIGSPWSESMGTIYAFPLWEHLVIYTLFIFLVWFIVLLPAIPKRERIASR
jgi:hypothetical protein